MRESGVTRCGVRFPAKARRVLPGAGGREPRRRARAARARGGWGGGGRGVASEPICRPRGRRAGHQLPAPLSRPDEPAQRGHRSPARSPASPGADPHPGPRERLSVQQPDGEAGAGGERRAHLTVEMGRLRPGRRGDPCPRPQHQGREGDENTSLLRVEGARVPEGDNESQGGMGKKGRARTHRRSADRRLVICKKFISTFKKEREPEGPGCPPDGGRRWGLEVGVGGQVP